MSWLRLPRILCIDLTFNWPPVGGCWVDAYHITKGLKERGAEVALLCPDFQDYYPRGDVREPLPFDLIKVPFNRFTFNAAVVLRRFREIVKAEKPDIVFLMDGSFMKGPLLRVHDPERTILRIYAFELNCPNLHYYRYQENRICEYGYLNRPDECRRCWFRRVPWWIRAGQVACYWPERHPRLHFSQEYIASGALTHTGWQRLREDLGRVGSVITYNPAIAAMFEPYAPRVDIIPSGVDAECFRPNNGECCQTEPDTVQQSLDGGDTSTSACDSSGTLRVFMPGRGNDPLKGLDTVIEAVRLLRRQGVELEVHYTAAMDYPSAEEWTINRGWVNQNQLPGLYREMDIVTVPSTWIEPFGITALEGMASGLPVLASRIGGLAGSVVDGETGYLIDPGSVEEWAQKLRILALAPELRRQMGENGRKRTQRRYAWHGIIDRYYVPLIADLMG